MRSFSPRPAVRKGQKLRLALDGPTGAGKTMSALIMAEVFGERTLLLDTERGSSQLYADRWTFDVVEWEPPFDPRELRSAMRELSAGYDTVIVDSLSHFWSEEGGTLDIVDSSASRFGGNRFAGWQEGTPAQRDLVEGLLRADSHVIVTMRSKMEYALDERNKPVKVGMAPVQRDGLEYEFTIVADLDLSHKLTVSKSRFDGVADRQYPKGHTDDFAAEVKAWLDTAEPLVTSPQVDTLRELIGSIADRDTREQTKREFKAEFGEPRVLVASRFDEAESFLAQRSIEAEADTEDADA